MSLQADIADIQGKLKANAYEHEAAVKLGIVLRLLGKMGWPVHDTQKVAPEYDVNNRKVDYALCDEMKQPRIFIEVKRQGNIEGADQQVFKYAFHEGIPFLVVTDGNEWHFYLSAGVGSLEERKVYNLDLIERDAVESEERLRRYLSYEEVTSGNALRNAQKDYESVSKERQAKKKIPVAWRKLLDEKDETLVGFLAEKVESLCGYRPNQDKIIEYLRSLKTEIALPPLPRPPTSEGHVHPPSARTAKRPPSTFKVIFPDGVEIYRPRATEAFVETFRKIGFHRVQSVSAQYLQLQPYGFPIVSQQQHRKEWVSAGSGYFVCTHSSTSKKIELLQQVNTHLNLGMTIVQVDRKISR